jgi:hypothetical protein
VRLFLRIFLEIFLHIEVNRGVRVCVCVCVCVCECMQVCSHFCKHLLWKCWAYTKVDRILQWGSHVPITYSSSINLRIILSISTAHLRYHITLFIKSSMYISKRWSLKHNQN